jgi:polysaccharide deacetylase 2 family uncharacterized protein YibQ
VALSITSDQGGSVPYRSADPGQWSRRILYFGVIPLTAVAVVAAGWYVATGETPLDVFRRLTAPPSVWMALPPRPGAATKDAPGGDLLHPPGKDMLAAAKTVPGKAPVAVAPLAPPGAAEPSAEEPEDTAPPPKPAKGVIPGPSPMKPTPLAKVAEIPPAPPPAPAVGAMPAPILAPPKPAAAAAAPASVAPAPMLAPAASAPPAATPAPMAAAPAAAEPTTPAPAATTLAPAPQTVAANAPPPPPVNEPQAPPGGEPLAPPSYAQLPARTDLKPPVPGPQSDLLRDSPDGPLPVIDPPKEARLAYARPFAPPKEKLARVAVVVVGLGLSREAAEAAIAKLPPEVSLSFSPYAGNLETWMKKARDAGHEVLIDLPLEPPNYPLHDAGPLAILASDGPNAAVDRLHAILGKATGYVGVAAAPRSPVAADPSWPQVLKELKSRGLLLVGDAPAGAAAAGDQPALAAVTYVPDQTPFRASIDAGLKHVLDTAQRDGAAVAYVSPRPVTFERLLAWAVSLPQKDAVLAPVSALANAKP